MDRFSFLFYYFLNYYYFFCRATPQKYGAAQIVSVGPAMANLCGARSARSDALAVARSPRHVLAARSTPEWPRGLANSSTVSESAAVDRCGLVTQSSWPELKT